MTPPAPGTGPSTGTGGGTTTGPSTGTGGGTTTGPSTGTGGGTTTGPSTGHGGETGTGPGGETDDSSSDTPAARVTAEASGGKTS